MAISFKTRIRSYCEKHEIFVPGGFDRHSASRYVIIRRDVNPPKLIAKTWFNQKDVAYHIKGMLQEGISGDINEAIDILDFKRKIRLRYRESGNLELDRSISI